jgi:hypothetical protein
MADETQEDYRLAVLRAAGHTEAAEILSKLPGMTAVVEKPEPEQTVTPVDAAEEARQAEGQGMLAAMRRSGVGQGWLEGGSV